MKSREEKRRKFNEAVVNMLYPPPQAKNEDLVLNNNENEDIENSEPFPGDLEINPSSDSEEDCEAEPPKLTRAQRKRLRRKKLTVDSCRRGQIIGPLLPPTQVNANGSPTVRQNATEELQESSDSGNKGRVKQRRKAKKLGRETQTVNLNSSNGEN